MSQAVKVMFLMLLFAGTMALNTNLDTDINTMRDTKDALELAVHDAALALDQAQLAQGQIVFDQERALNNFQQSLEYNLDLDSRYGYLYEPTADSFYQHDFTLDHFEVIDHSTSSFPFNYSNPKYDIVEYIDGPSIVAVISTKSPRYFAGEGIYTRRAVVYEYNN
ncbi:hypothetical protein [Pontibacillus halophilus]|uniref:hypothetical protein n=1 Tax=Pontibacillus halophilus TaxID=516704 RepID=UPI0003F7EE47|nr:hypothetical protein [Pontibacillus halophilus]